MKNALLILPAQKGYVVAEVPPEKLPDVDWRTIQCFTHLDHYSRSETVIEAIKEHFRERPNA